MMQAGSFQQEQPPRHEPRPAEPEAFPWKPAQAAGEYTKIFESPQSQEDPYPPARAMPIHSGSTDVFGVSPTPRAAPVKAGPSEYTQMLSTGNAQKPEAAASQKPAPAKPEATKMPAKTFLIAAGILIFLAIVLLLVLLVNR
jgi:hypothetical protein